VRRAAPLAALGLAAAVAALLGALADRVAADAIAAFEASHARGAAPAERGRAEAAARRLHERGDDPATRALGANLLGVLAVEDALLERGSADRHVAASVEAFREAIRLDPSNDDAKFNLELVLTLAPEEARVAPGPGPVAGPAAGSGAGATPPGGGY
jgi:hypothetical protein